MSRQPSVAFLVDVDARLFPRGEDGHGWRDEPPGSIVVLVVVESLVVESLVVIESLVVVESLVVAIADAKLGG